MMRQRWSEHEVDPALAVRGYAVTHPPGTIVMPTAPGWNQLLYMSTQLEALPQAWLAVSVPALLRELILYAVRICPLDLRRPEHERLIGVLLDQLTALPHTPLQLPMPTDPAAVALAVGYSTPSAFGVMFRDHLGASPGTYFRT